LKPGVETFKGTVKSVVRPVYDQYHGVPVELLKFVDTKLDESVTKLDRRVQPVIKQVSSEAILAAKKAPEVAHSVASDVRQAPCRGGKHGLRICKSVYAEYEPTTKEPYAKCESKAEQCAVSAWRRLSELPLFPHVASVVVPTAAYCTDKYNRMVVGGAEKGYKVASSYLPFLLRRLPKFSVSRGMKWSH
ncbi:REF/SRPP-like protein At3g05500, partial [Hibiscus syriacus]|uniref:REF/SRPP-like protein At3g05500 n=1 Tax=Hibiscus syriacus TaxID=106335 RepID=UPI0019234088